MAYGGVSNCYAYERDKLHRMDWELETESSEESEGMSDTDYPTVETHCTKDINRIKQYSKTGDEELLSNIRRFIKQYLATDTKRDMIIKAFEELWTVGQFRSYMTTNVYLQAWKIDNYILNGSELHTEQELKECDTPLEEFIKRLASYISEIDMIYKEPVDEDLLSGEKWIREEKWKYCTTALWDEVICIVQYYIRKGKLQ